MARPTSMQICVASWDYGSVNPSGDVVMSLVKPETQRAWQAANSGIIGAGFKYAGLSDITDVYYCPVDYKNNLQVFNSKGLNQNNVPALIVSALYPDGRGKAITLKGDLTGNTKWEQSKIERALEILWLDLDPGECDLKLLSWIPIIGPKISQFLCRLPAFLWAAATVYMTYKAATSPKQRCKVIAGAGAAGSLYMFNRAGGLNALNPKW